MRPRNRGLPTLSLLCGQACPRKALENLVATLHRPFLTPDCLGPTYLSLPLHFSFSLREKKKQLQASMFNELYPVPWRQSGKILDFRNL